MQARGYFLSEEAEKAKLWDMQKELEAVRLHLGALDDEFKKIAKAWRGMAVFFDSTSGYSFVVQDDMIKGINDHTGATSSLPKKYVTYECLAALISDLQESRKRAKELEQNLNPPKNVG